MRLYVGNLPFSTTTAELESLFGQAGAVTSVDIVTDKFSGRSRGFGFVEMPNAREAQDAIERFNGYELQGRPLTVNEAKPMEQRPGGTRRSGGEREGREGGGSQRQHL